MQNRFKVELCLEDKNSLILLAPGFNLCAFKVAVGPKSIFYAHKRKFLLAAEFRVSLIPLCLPSSLSNFLAVQCWRSASAEVLARE